MVLGISSKKMRTAVEKADTVVHVRDDHHKYPDGVGEGGGLHVLHLHMPIHRQRPCPCPSCSGRLASQQHLRLHKALEGGQGDDKGWWTS